MPGVWTHIEIQADGFKSCIGLAGLALVRFLAEAWGGITMANMRSQQDISWSLLMHE